MRYNSYTDRRRSNLRLELYRKLTEAHELALQNEQAWIDGKMSDQDYQSSRAELQATRDQLLRLQKTS